MQNYHESRFGSLYRRAYELICGKPPLLRIWHFQWLSIFYLVKTLRYQLPNLRGRILDVGCGDKPYRQFFSQVTDYVGIDITDGADIVVTPNALWPLDDMSFDVVFATQVVEHVECLPHTMAEIARVCKPGGVILLSLPFLYHEHGTPYDFQRFTTHGAVLLLPYEIVMIERQGGFGSTLVILLLSWLNDMLNTNKVTRYFKAFLLPFWLPFCMAMNCIGLALDAIDRTKCFYSNIFVIFRKPYLE